MKKFAIFILFFILLTSINLLNNAQASDKIYKNKLFSISIPENLNGIYNIKTDKDKISVFHKESKKAGFGGFAFGIKAYKNPADHAVLPGSRKLGELADKSFYLYDIVLIINPYNFVIIDFNYA